MVTPLSLFVTARWFALGRLPPAERPLTLHEVQASRALAHGRDKFWQPPSGRQQWPSFFSCYPVVQLRLEVTEGLRTSWFLILGQGSAIMGFGAMRVARRWRPPTAASSQRESQ